MALTVTKHRFNVTDYQRMIAAGVFAEDDALELIEGEVVEMSPIGYRHAACVDCLADEISGLDLRHLAILSVQNPIRTGEESMPQPDLALLRRRPDLYRLGRPEPRDLLLVVEVAETSVRYDREIKIPLYARAGIVEVWLIDLAADRVEVYTDPSGGVYRTVRSAARGERIVAGAIEGLSLEVDRILGAPLDEAGDDAPGGHGA